MRSIASARLRAYSSSLLATPQATDSASRGHRIRRPRFSLPACRAVRMCGVAGESTRRPVLVRTARGSKPDPDHFSTFACRRGRVEQLLRKGDVGCSGASSTSATSGTIVGASTTTCRVRRRTADLVSRRPRPPDVSQREGQRQRIVACAESGRSRIVLFIPSAATTYWALIMCRFPARPRHHRQSGSLGGEVRAVTLPRVPRGDRQDLLGDVLWDHQRVRILVGSGRRDRTSSRSPSRMLNCELMRAAVLRDGSRAFEMGPPGFEPGTNGL